MTTEKDPRERKDLRDQEFLGKVNDVLREYGVRDIRGDTDVNLEPFPGYVPDKFDHKNGIIGLDLICMMGCGSRASLNYDPTAKKFELKINVDPGYLRERSEEAKSSLRENLGLENDVDMKIIFSNNPI
jgi:hypothetical protein